jgi:hypothetical protein
MINITMRVYEFASPIKTFVARVKLKNGSTVIATERTESLSYARMLFQHKFGDRNVFSVSELKEQVNEIEEGTKTLSSAELQVKALADQEAKYKKQKRQLQARQGFAKAQEKLRQATAL